MHILTNNDYKLFCSLAQVSQESLRKTLRSFLYKKYQTVYATEDYLYAVGDIPVALCAHMDTVFPKPPKEIFYDREKGVLWSPTGLGADDRAGIFAIIKILQSGLKPTIIFCADEEKGALGAEKLVHDHPLPISPLNFIMELDRRGTNDCVFYDCANQEFTDYIEERGFSEAWGSFSDISELCPNWGVAGVNLSIGYESEHTTSEILRIGPMLDTIEKVKKILKESEWPVFKYVHKPYSYYGAWGSMYPTEYDNWGFKESRDDAFDSSYHTCGCCGILLHDYETIPAIDPDGDIKYFCPDCCAGNVEWCKICGSSFTIGTLPASGICEDCISKYGNNRQAKKRKGKK